jgi:hypothetical protein
MSSIRTHAVRAAALAAILAAPAVPAQTTLLHIDYETGTQDSGIPGMIGTDAPAADAASMVSDKPRSGRFAIAHKVTLRNPDYVSFGAPRSESTAGPVVVGGTRPGQYAPGQHRLYTFSLMLKDWEPWLPTSGSAPIDILWQFKHFNGGPDLMIGVRRNQMVLRYANKQALLVDDVRLHNNRWIDFRFDIVWAKDASGRFTAEVRLDDQADYVRKAEETAFPTFNPAYAGTAGTIQWGLYRPDSEQFPAAALTRRVYHDDITVTRLP